MNVRRASAVAVAMATLLVVGGCSSKDSDDAGSAAQSVSPSSASSPAAGESEASPSGKGSKKAKGSKESSPAAGATAPSPSPPPSDMPTDDPTIETSDGATISTSGDLPEGFPAGEVPVVSGVVLSSTNGDGLFNIVLTHDEAVKKTYTTAVDKLTKAGLTVKETRDGRDARFARLTSSTWEVQLAVIGMGTTQSSVNYYVVRR